MDLRQQLIDLDISQPSLEARELVAYVAGKTREEFYRDLRIYVPDNVVEETAKIVMRRLDGEPLAYIIGEWEFMGLPLNIDRNVLIPRTDTELLAQIAIDFVKTKSNSRVLDMCTGCGCLGISIAAFVPECRVTLADISSAALRVARSNLRRHELSARVACVMSDAMKQGSITLGNFDLIVSNPPYIPTADIETLDNSVSCYEPHLALDGGDDGLIFYRKIASGYRHLIKKGGALMFECGIGQAQQITEILKRYGYTQIDIINDGNGIERVIKCTT